jgi:hypothetical protein
MLLRLPKIKFVIVTLGEKGCLMLERSTIGMFTLSLHVNVSQAFTIIHGYLLLCILPAMGSVPFSLAYLAQNRHRDTVGISREES